MTSKIMTLPVVQEQESKEKMTITPNETPHLQIVWINVFIYILAHLAAIYGLYVAVYKCSWWTVIYSVSLVTMGHIGITAGYHRLLTHRSFKARLPLKILLLIWATFSGQNSALFWIRIHRTHHKYADTDADPHNSKRGFFFSHIGWILMTPHREAKAKSKTIDMSDVINDPILKFQYRHYSILVMLFNAICVYIPTLWGETLWNAFFVSGILRHNISCNCICMVNSVAHKFGSKPYDKNIAPVESKIVSWLAMGEGGHNFHHAFPWDYKLSEFSGNDTNFIKLFIDFMAAIGWAYDLKYVSDDIARKRALRTGDGCHKDLDGF